jgi:hypothetical protein
MLELLRCAGFSIPRSPWAVVLATRRGAPRRRRPLRATRRSTHFLLREDVAIDQRTGRAGTSASNAKYSPSSGAPTCSRRARPATARSIEVEVYDPGLRPAFRRCYPSRRRLLRGVIRVRGDVQVTERLTNTPSTNS